MRNQDYFRCPNLECTNSKAPTGRWFVRKGDFLQKWSGHRVPRYRCKCCGKQFSTSTFKDICNQKKPFLNKQVYNFLCSGSSQRRLAENLGVARNTVVSKFRFLATKARKIHACEVVTGGLFTTEVQFDEQESFERTKKLPLSIAIAVDGRWGKGHGEGRIIDIEVASMPARGRNAKDSQFIYGFRKDEREYGCCSVLATVKAATGGAIKITTDAKPQYPGYVRRVLEDATHKSFVNGRQEMVSRGERHPLWWLNQACAANRHDLGRLRRRTCITTKKVLELRRHLWLYVAHRNEYEKDLFDPLFWATKFAQTRLKIQLQGQKMLGE